MCGDTQDLQLIPREPGHETRVDDPEQVQLVHPADTRLQLVIPLEPPEVIADYQAKQVVPECRRCRDARHTPPPEAEVPRFRGEDGAPRVGCVHGAPRVPPP